MTPSKLLLRQVHPGFVQAGRIASQVFRPTPKDEGYLSVDNGDLITPQLAWQHFAANPAVASAGTMAVTWAQCEELALPVQADAVPYPEHCSIDYTAHPKKAIEHKAKILRVHAQMLGWLWQTKGDE